jgi:hypothetical protein
MFNYLILVDEETGTERSGNLPGVTQLANVRARTGNQCGFRICAFSLMLFCLNASMSQQELCVCCPWESSRPSILMARGPRLLFILCSFALLLQGSQLPDSASRKYRATLNNKGDFPGRSWLKVTISEKPIRSRV